MTYAATVRVHPVWLWLLAVMILMWLLVSLWAQGKLISRERCEHGASSIVMTNGKVSKPHRTGCLP
jgi:thiosulfate reductase cytochrome b subunit